MVQYRVEWYVCGVLYRRNFETYEEGFRWWHEAVLLDEYATFERVENLGF